MTSRIPSKPVTGLSLLNVKKYFRFIIYIKFCKEINNKVNNLKYTHISMAEAGDWTKYRLICIHLYWIIQGCVVVTLPMLCVACLTIPDLYYTLGTGLEMGKCSLSSCRNVCCGIDIVLDLVRQWMDSRVFCQSSSCKKYLQQYFYYYAFYIVYVIFI